MYLRSISLHSAVLLVSTFLAAGAGAQRLPTGVHPEHYKLALTPDLKAGTFSGTEMIVFVLDAPTSSITLNSAEIKISSVKALQMPTSVIAIKDEHGKYRQAAPYDLLAGDLNPQIGAVSYDASKEQVTFTFPKPIPSGEVGISIAYTGILNDKLRGFYLSKTKARNYAVTQFEPTDARRAFPSFDEPAYKATFDVSLTVDAGDTVIANGPLVSDTPTGPGKHTMVFGRTPKMSTYLVAFQVGDFQCTSGKADGVPIRVCSTPDKVKYTGFALEAAEHILTYYDKYFGIKYPMQKLDLIGLPDFEAGAMENFGCITYRETDLLVDKDASIDAKKRVALVVSHEMAHQWFGDMVTMQWWDNLWLNEGFATWMSTKPIAKWHPEWMYPEDDANTLDGTLNLDAQPTTHPILAKDTETTDQINELFDGITYGKGGAVIGMVENYLGEEVFRKGVHNYLAEHLYGNATAEDFWGAQTSTSHQPVDTIMSSFVAQPGVPLLRIGKDLDVTQSRFYLDPARKEIPVSGRLPVWSVPVCLKGEKKTQTCAVVSSPLTMSPDRLTMPEGAPFLYANAGNHGYYRTIYTPTQLKAITAGAESSLSAPERIGLLGDQYALMRAGQGSVGDFLDLAFAFKADPSAPVLESALLKTESIEGTAGTPETEARLDGLLLREFGPVYRSLGKPSRSEPYNVQARRTILFSILGVSGDKNILADARTLTEEVFAGKKPLDPALTDAAVVVAARNGDSALYDKLQDVAENATDPGLKSDALTTLAKFQDPLLVVRTLEYASSGKVRNQDSWILFSTLLQQQKTREIAWQYIQQHWPAVSAQFTTNSGVRVVAAAGSFCTVQQRDEVTTFFATHHVDAAERTLSKSIDSINDCIGRRAVQKPQLESWLAAHP